MGRNGHPGLHGCAGTLVLLSVAMSFPWAASCRISEEKRGRGRRRGKEEEEEKEAESRKE